MWIHIALSVLVSHLGGRLCCTTYCQIVREIGYESASNEYDELLAES
jgi:hypothetical protein